MDALGLMGVGRKKQLHFRRQDAAGHSHEPLKFSLLSEEEADREKKAKGRGMNALAVLREKQAVENEERQRHVVIRRQAVQVEKRRAKLVSSLPLPCKEMLTVVKKDKFVEVYDIESMGISRIPIPANVTRKCPPGAERDAYAAAAEYREEIPLGVDESKTKARFRRALAKEKVVRSYEEVMKDLEKHKQKTCRVVPPGTKFFKVPASALPCKKFSMKEKASEEAVEGIFRERNENVIINKKKRKSMKRARLSVGKNRAIRTPKGTVTTKLSATSSLQMHIRNEKAKRCGFSSLLYRSSGRLSNVSSSSKGSLRAEITDWIPPERKTLLVSRSPPRSFVQEDRATFELEDVQRSTRECGSQTNWTFHPNSFGKDFPDSPPSSTSYLSLPADYGTSPSVARLLAGSSRATQTPEDAVTVYHRFLLNRAKFANRNAPVRTASDRVDVDLAPYIRELAKQHFTKDGSERETRTSPTREVSRLFSPEFASLAKYRPTKFFPDVDSENVAKSEDAVVRRSPLRKTACIGSKTRKIHFKSAKSNTTKSLPAEGSKKSGKSERDPQQKGATLRPQNVPVKTMVMPVSPPLTLTLESQKSTLVVQLEESDAVWKSAKDCRRILGSTNINVTSKEKQSQNKPSTCIPKLPNKEQGSFIKIDVTPPMSNAIFCSSRQSDSPAPFPTRYPSESDDPTSPLQLCLEKEHPFRPHPPASLPLGWRQMQTPHELSTICEIDTPPTSFLEGERSQIENTRYSLAGLSSKGEILSKEDIRIDTKVPLWEEIYASEDNQIDSIVPLWEEIYASLFKSPSLTGSGYSTGREDVGTKRIPSQSTPIKGNSFNIELEAGIEDQSFISLVGSEVTSEERRVPDVNESISEGEPASWYSQRSLKPSPPLPPPLTDSILSFMRHEISCASLSPGKIV